MEEVLYRLHVRTLILAGDIFNNKSRQKLEHFALFNAFLSLGVFLLLHFTYISNHNQYFQSTLFQTSQYGICSKNGMIQLNNNNLQYHNSNLNLISLWQPNNYSPLRFLRPENSYENKTANLSLNMPSEFDVVRIVLLPNLHLDKKITEVYSDNIFDDAALNHSIRVYLFAQDRGLLILGEDNPLKSLLKVTSIYLTKKNNCLRARFANWIADHVVGYDTIIMNWAMTMFAGQGYLYNNKTGELYNLNFARELMTSKGESMRTTSKQSHMDTSQRNNLLSILKFIRDNKYTNQIFSYLNQWHGDRAAVNLDTSDFASLGTSVQLFVQYAAFRIGILFSTTFLFFTMTTMVSYTLRETQERMVRFTYALQHHIVNEIPFMRLVFTHVIEILVFVPIMVGLTFFLFEFYSDQLLAFLVLLIVWMGEVFSILNLRTRTTIQFFPKFFAALFYLFHIYFFSHPFGFSFCALTTAMLFMLYIMMYFMNRNEIPSFEAGSINSTVPRIGLLGSQNLVFDVRSPSRPNPSGLDRSDGSNHIRSIHTDRLIAAGRIDTGSTPSTRSRGRMMANVDNNTTQSPEVQQNPNQNRREAVDQKSALSLKHQNHKARLLYSARSMKLNGNKVIRRSQSPVSPVSPVPIEPLEQSVAVSPDRSSMVCKPFPILTLEIPRVNKSKSHSLEDDMMQSTMMAPSPPMTNQTSLPSSSVSSPSSSINPSNNYTNNSLKLSSSVVPNIYESLEARRIRLKKVVERESIPYSLDTSPHSSIPSTKFENYQMSNKRAISFPVVGGRKQNEGEAGDSEYERDAEFKIFGDFFDEVG